MLTSSTYTVDPPEVDGRFNVTETHTADDGQEYSYSYLCAPNLTNPQFVLEERAALVNSILAARAAARLLVQGTSVPITRFEFLDRFTQAERVTIREHAKSDPYTLDFMELMNASGNVSLPRARLGLAYLTSVGVITADRAAVIGAE